MGQWESDNVIDADTITRYKHDNRTNLLGGFIAMGRRRLLCFEKGSGGFGPMDDERILT